ncbi:hypothetical protein MMA231_03906 (plasmid) [Asticcacaulis sp. MM231]|uniref:YoaK family protein n=1 Tax=Asticcacaulis sp. MM231 TaxID=3157666 RepID=UPI0032D56F4B
MNTLPRPATGLAIGLSALAGFVDAIGFLELRGIFVSFMSGNSTQLAVALTEGHVRAVASLGGIIALFVLGVIAGTLTGHFSESSRRMIGVMGLVTVLLGAATCFHLALHVPLAVVACLTLAMGAENAVFSRNGDVVVGVTYMTGTLVKVAQKLSQAVTGGAPWAWVPWLGLWIGLIVGGISGALAYHALGLSSVTVAFLAAAGLTLYTWGFRVSGHHEESS